MLEGKSAIGPENNEEAIRIWREISKIPLARLLEEIIIENEFKKEYSIPATKNSAGLNSHGGLTPNR